MQRKSRPRLRLTPARAAFLAAKLATPARAAFLAAKLATLGAGLAIFAALTALGYRGSVRSFEALDL